MRRGIRLAVLSVAAISGMTYPGHAWAHPGHGDYSIQVVRSISNTRVLAVTGTTAYARVDNDQFQLLKSDDEFVTTQLLFRFPSFAPLRELTVLRSGTLIAHVGTSPYSIWRSTNGGVTFTRVFDFPSSGSSWAYETLIPDNLIQDNQGRAYLSTYNTCSCELTRNYMWYSDTDGATWQPVPGFSPDASGNLPPIATAFRHIHSLEYDEQTGTLYVIAGDGQGGIWKSTDRGGSFQPVCTGRYTDCVAVDAEAGSGFLIYGTDSPYTNANSIYRLATNTSQPPSAVQTTKVLSIPYTSYASAKLANGVFLVGETRETTQPLLADRLLHVYAITPDGVHAYDAWQFSVPDYWSNVLVKITLPGQFASGDFVITIFGRSWVVRLVESGSTPTPPANLSAPTISGTAQVGQTLTGGQGAWSGNPTPTLTNAWLRCDTNGANCASTGASGATYTLVSADEGRRMIFRVTGTNSAGTATASSAPSAIVQAQPSSPSNLCLNPGFETNPVEYSFYGTGTASWASDAAHTGSRSAKIVSTDESLSRWTQFFDVAPGQRYLVSTWVKTSSGRGSLAVNFWNSGTYSGVNYETAGVSGDWQKITLDVTVPAGVNRMRLELRTAWTAGTRWFDDVEVVRVQ